jgi:hypothetical protein
MSWIKMLEIKGVDTFKCFAISSPVANTKCYNKFMDLEYEFT